ncbi:hypothetical protein ILYODFUR_021956 [Ilyodon furcidens]|uniref:SPX domain-containing protein n=1 Tax=Ilyodon furcidens TaxID=33524 RepID=A0ABV0UK15_9TELE
MKFAEHLASHITPEWRKQYLLYEAFKDMLYAAQDQAPSIEDKSVWLARFFRAPCRAAAYRPRFPLSGPDMEWSEM